MRGRPLLSLFLILSTATAVVADELGIEKCLMSTERALKLSTTPTNTLQALVQKDLELKRSEYARTLQLVADGIESEKRLEKARIEYEKDLIKASAGKAPIKFVMNQINKMRAGIRQWTAEQLAARNAGQQM